MGITEKIGIGTLLLLSFSSTAASQQLSMRPGRSNSAGHSATVAQNGGCAQAILPAGTLVYIRPEEQIQAGNEEGPVLWRVSRDVRPFRNSEVVIPEDSLVESRVLISRQAGRIRGVAELSVSFISIVTPAFCRYSIRANLVEANGHQIRDNIIKGKSHRVRDTIFHILPPFALVKVFTVWRRGPKLIVDSEEELVIKLLSDLFPAQDLRSGNW